MSPAQPHPVAPQRPTRSRDNAFLRPRDDYANQRRTSLRRGDGCAGQPREPQNHRGRRSCAPPAQSNGRGRPTAPLPGWSDRRRGTTTSPASPTMACADVAVVRLATAGSQRPAEVASPFGACGGLQLLHPPVEVLEVLVDVVDDDLALRPVARTATNRADSGTPAALQPRVTLTRGTHASRERESTATRAPRRGTLPSSSGPWNALPRAAPRRSPRCGLHSPGDGRRVAAGRTTPAGIRGGPHDPVDSPRRLRATCSSAASSASSTYRPYAAWACSPSVRVSRAQLGPTRPLPAANVGARGRPLRASGGRAVRSAVCRQRRRAVDQRARRHGLHVSRTIRTAPALNSGSYLRRGCDTASPHRRCLHD